VDNVELHFFQNKIVCTTYPYFNFSWKALGKLRNFAHFEDDKYVYKIKLKNHFSLFNKWYDNPVSILLMNFDGLVYIIQGGGHLKMAETNCRNIVW
jgi:hypothetical protein